MAAEKSEASVTNDSHEDDPIDAPPPYDGAAGVTYVAPANSGSTGY